MPVVKTVSVTYGRKFNLGDYNSATVDCTIWADLDPEENLDAAMHDLWAMAKENVKSQAQPLLAKNGANANVKEFFLGLPADLQKVADAELVAAGIDPSDGLPFGDK